MPRSEPVPLPKGCRRLDWRGWIILAWAVWFGVLYGRMVVERRGGKFRGWIAREAPPPAGGVTPARGTNS
jgi:hypothetical protein